MNTVLSNFNFRGRLSRAGFWWQTLLIWILFMVINAFFLPVLGNVATWLFSLLGIYALAALAVRRLHDRNLSGKWLLVVLVPIAGAAWLFWQLACRKGIVDSNRWGKNPLVSNADFLVVR
jgi:uncharacterized membrane protein YhaH (DUF805 family)